jgi:hypothetical protein
MLMFSVFFLILDVFCLILDAGFTTADLSSFPALFQNRTVAAGAATVVTGPTTLPATTSPMPDMSNAYIHISTCYTGGIHPKSEQFQQQKQQLQPKTPTPASPTQQGANSGPNNRSALELSNYEMGDDSVFLSSTDEADTSFSPARNSVATTSGNIPMPPLLPPTRPPKPKHLAAMQSTLAAAAASGSGQQQNYANSVHMQDVYQKEVAKNVIESNNNSPWATPPSPTTATSFVPAPPRDMKPGRNAYGDNRSATVDPKILKNRTGARQQQQHFSTMAPPGRTTSSTIPAPPTNAPPVERALKPKNGERWNQFFFYFSIFINIVIHFI